MHQYTSIYLVDQIRRERVAAADRYRLAARLRAAARERRAAAVAEAGPRVAGSGRIQPRPVRSNT